MTFKVRSVLPILIVVMILVGLPLGILAYESARTGKTWSQVVGSLLSRAGTSKTGLEGMSAGILPKGEKIDFLTSRPIGDVPADRAMITYLAAVDLDQDGMLDVVVCDAQANRVTWIRQGPRGTFTEKVCGEGLIAPAHVEAIDFDGDGDLDLVVAVLGMLFPNNDKIGSVVILENTGAMQFTKRVVIERIARVADVRAGDLDGDGDMDLAVAQFGYDDGETRWMENLGQWKFKSHILQTLSGPIHSEIVDIDKDGDLDIVVLVSQEWEEIYVFVNDGKGNFTPRLIYGSPNDDFGSSGISVCDFDRDGDVDILYTNGDAFDYVPPRPRPWHGVQWLENQGDLKFKFHRIANYPGAYNARPVDIDGDGDLDAYVVSTVNYWERPEAQSLIWLENNGKMQFRRHDITNTPTHLLAIATGDFDGDGQIDLVTGGMHFYPPYDRLARVLLWTAKWPGASKKH